jgi:hypothetical protein
MGGLYFFIAAFIFASNAFALDPRIARFIETQNRFNPAYGARIRSNDPVVIEHYEIPLSVLEVRDAGGPASALMKEGLIFQKNGVATFRWVINPQEANHEKGYYRKVEAWLKGRALSTERHRFFKGYLTASRSVVLENPATGRSFSLKTSTNVLDGFFLDNYPDKSHSWHTARREFDNFQYIHRHHVDSPDSHFFVVDEPFSVGIPEINLAVSGRDLSALELGAKNWVPGFSSLHEEYGKLLALKNGFHDPTDFATHVYRLLGRAVAEQLVEYGEVSDSLHGQNWILETDEDMKLTGRIGFADLGDADLIPEIATALGEAKFLEEFEGHTVSQGSFAVSVYDPFGFRASVPNWLDAEKWQNVAGHPERYAGTWRGQFFDEFEKTVSERTGVPRAILRHPDHYPFNRTGSEVYSLSVSYEGFGDYREEIPEWSAFFKHTRLTRGCPSVFTEVAQ